MGIQRWSSTTSVPALSRIPGTLWYPKQKTWRWREEKCRALECAQTCYHLKIDCYKYKLFYVSFMVTTEQKPAVNTQKIKRKESKHTTAENHQITKEQNRSRRKEQELQNSQKTITNNKMAISTQLSIIKYMEKALAPHSSSLAWKIPWAEEPGRLQSMGSQRVGHDWATSLSLFTFVHWRRKWQPTPVFLPAESQGQGSLVGCHLWGHTESDLTEVT